MRAESWKRQTLDIEGWPVHLTSYFLGGRYLAEVEAISSGVTIARAADVLRDDAETQALEKAGARLRATKWIDFDLTVGG